MKPNMKFVVFVTCRQAGEEGSRVVRHRLSFGGREVRLGVQAEENGLRSTHSHCIAFVVHCKNIRISTNILWRVFHS